MKRILAKIMENAPKKEIPAGTDIRQKRVEWYNNSEGNLHLEDGYECSACKNRGDIWYLDEDGNEYCKPCKCQRVRAALKRAKRSGLGDILKEYTFAKYDATEDWQKDIKEKAQEFCKDDAANWFYIGGQVGCGKTHVCTAICAHYIKAGCELRYMLWAEDSKFLKANINEPVYQERMDELKNVDVLYIDDFLKVKSGAVPTDADINLAFEIINHRLLNDKITIISSEKQLNEIMEYDEATMSRIYQRAGAYKFSIGKDMNKNYRLKG